MTSELPLELVVTLWKLGQSELNRENGQSNSKSEEMAIMRVAMQAKEWVRTEREKANAKLADVQKNESQVRLKAVGNRPGEYRKVFSK